MSVKLTLQKKGKSGEIRRKSSKSAPEFREIFVREKVWKSGDPWSNQEVW
jgi:hypothetical protein